MCWGYSVPDCKTYKSDDPQENKWGWFKWDKQLLLKQQNLFFSALQKYNVELIELKTKPELIWQMYIRDIAFVIEDTLYYAKKRTLKARRGEIKTLFVGNNVMHLDTRLALLPNDYALVHIEAFTKEDKKYLSKKYKIIPVSKEESHYLGANVFVVNPETVFVEKSQRNIQEQIIKAGFKVEAIPYTEPIALSGSFRCTTLPLVRE